MATPKVSQRATGDLHYVSATEALRMFRSRELSPVELLQAQIERAEKVEPKINAFAECRFESARSEAREAEARYAGKGQSPRALEGLAVAVKEEAPIAGQKNTLDHHLIPNVIYTHPEVATVGSTETELTKQGRAVKVGRFGFIANGRAKAAGENEGFVKIIADATTDRVLGAAIIGPRASDLLAEINAVMAFGGSSEDIARTCHAHPTFSESVKEAALDVMGRALHA